LEADKVDENSSEKKKKKKKGRESIGRAWTFFPGWITFLS